MKNNKENFSGLDVSALTAYTDQTGGLNTLMLQESDTISKKLAKIEYGAEGDRVAINNIRASLLGSNTMCGAFAGSGATVLTQSYVQMFPVRFENPVCISDLEKYYTSFLAEKEFNTESAGNFEEYFNEAHLKEVSKTFGKLFWQGETNTPAYASVSGNLALANGFLSNAYKLSATTVNVKQSGMTSVNAYGIVDAYLASGLTVCPELLNADRIEMKLSPIDYQNYIISMRALNLFNANTFAVGDEIQHPASLNLFVQKVQDMAGVASGTFLMSYPENFVIKISNSKDLEYKTVFRENTDELVNKTKARIGVGFAVPEHVVCSNK